jgi:hypothetical protein
MECGFMDRARFREPGLGVFCRFDTQCAGRGNTQRIALRRIRRLKCDSRGRGQLLRSKRTESSKSAARFRLVSALFLRAIRPAQSPSRAIALSHR